MELISVIIPIYKVEPYLHKCLDSVLNQTYTNLEIILVDDGSPDNCGAICDEYAGKDRRVKVIHQKNRGLSCARNAGLDIATGNYISFVDSDDFIDANMLEKLHTVLLAHNADIAECGYRWVKPDKIVDKLINDGIELYSSEEALKDLYYGEQHYRGLSIVVWNKLFKADVIRGIRFAQGINNEDCLYTPMAYWAAKRIAKLNENLYNFNIRQNSITRSEYNPCKADSCKIYKLVMQFFLEKGAEEFFQIAQAKYFNELFFHYYECRKRKKRIEFEQLAQELYTEIKELYDTMLECPSFKNQSWRVKLFRFSPSCWFAVMWAGKTFKHYKWMICRKICVPKKRK